MIITMRAIGTVRNERYDRADEGWGRIESRLELAPEFAEGLDGLEQWSHALIVFWMHRDPGEEPNAIRRRPRQRADMPLLGVFAQRGRVRPNVIGVTAVRIVRVEPGVLTVRGLDALDGTPLLDVKPYAPVFDRVDDATVPEWFTTLMRGYF